MKSNLAQTHSNDAQHIVRRVNSIVMFLDMEDSVRMMQNNETATVYRWLRLVDEIEKEDLPNNNGKLLKQLGDGLLIRFDDATPAVTTAFAIQRRAKAHNQGYSEAEKINLRFAITGGTIIETGADIFGHEVNVCARLMSIAHSDDIFVTREVREALSDTLDGYVEDLGEIYVRNLSDPIKAYRISRDELPVRNLSRSSSAKLHPILAVMPFVDGNETIPASGICGLSDELTDVLAHSAVVDVISMMSAKALEGKNLSAIEIGDALGVDYVVSGKVISYSDGIFDLVVELCKSDSHLVVWRSNLSFSLTTERDERHSILTKLAERIVGAISSGEVRYVRDALLETLSERTLLTAAITLSYRLNREDFVLGGQILETLIARAPKEAQLHAHLADWHLMRVHQGWSDNLERDSFLATAAAQRALDLSPENSVALMVDGEVQAYFKRDLNLAEFRYNQSLDVNPNNAEALLMRGALFAFTDRGEAAVEDVLRAARLSPLNPNKYLYDSIAGSAYLTAGDYERALAFAESSLRANRLHTSTLRVLAVAHWQLDQQDAARRYVQHLLELDPGFRVGTYLNRAPSANYKIGHLIAECLRSAGAPE